MRNTQRVFQNGKNLRSLNRSIRMNPLKMRANGNRVFTPAQPGNSIEKETVL